MKPAAFLQSEEGVEASLVGAYAALEITERDYISSEVVQLDWCEDRIPLNNIRSFKRVPDPDGIAADGECHSFHKIG